MKHVIRIVERSDNHPAGLGLMCQDVYCAEQATLSIRIEVFGREWQMWSCVESADKLEAEIPMSGGVNSPTFKDPQQAFEDAIESGRLSANSTDENFAGHFMYMGTWPAGDMFKNKETRRYLADATKEGKK